ncbi:hypothetical protein [Rathayibacter sp. AY1E1]|uniref:hypothetical protein n=1 Tax=Rathayibacter sp. AY1E1 TaxID=2080549 RepID=UPI000CE8AB51|nr:hypothetical protein [Rathayibacter sp. AY1E1]PPH51205.1 hypothetical protein C5C67_11865 [Rathayibacter sp. AY1E1]
MFPFRRLLWRRRVIVNLVDGSAFDGILYRQSGPLLVLRDATRLERGAEPLQLDGEAVIERDRVLYIQAL